MIREGVALKYVPTPEFASKVSSASAAALSAVKRFVAFISDATDSDFNESNAISKLSSDELCVWKSLDAWIVFSIGKDEAGGSYVLIADLVDLNRTEQTDEGVYGAKNPKVDRRYNPKVNSRINPRVNSQLNPKVNSRLNPRVNSTINPRVNSVLNPRVNSSINYRVNSTINPRVNASLNPRVNSTINPKVNRVYGGPFVYDVDLNRQGHIVRVGEKISLAFDGNNSLWRIAVSRDGGFSVFNQENQYVEHWVADQQGGYLRFNTDNDWLGIVV